MSTVPLTGAALESRRVPARARERPPTWLVLAAFAAVYLIWGSTYLAIHLAIASIPPLLMAGARFLCAGAVLYTVMRLRGAPRPTLVHWGNAGIIGALLLLVGNGGVTWGQQTVPSGIAALMVAAVPLWMNLFDWLRLRESRPSASVVAGILFGFAGVALIVFGHDRTGSSAVDPRGAAALVIAPICWAIGSLYSRRAPQSSSALLSIAMQMICGGALMLAGGVLLGELPRLSIARISSSSLAAFGYLTFIGSLVGFTAYVWLLQVSTPARVSSYAYVNPLIAVVLGSVVLGEAIPGRVVVAGALIVGAVILITRVKAERES